MVGSIKKPMILAIFEGMNFINHLVLTMQNTSGVKKSHQINEPRGARV